MKESLLRQAAKLKQKNHNHKRWQKAVSILACVVVFCTVYALILPAVTMEQTAYCGKEEHTHTEDCYKKELICGKEEGEGAHHHTDACYQEKQVLVCTQEETDGHQHTDDCYTEESVLTCTNEDPDHVHGDECYTLQKVLTCGQKEGEGAHHHTAECYETQKTAVCGQEENDGHHHTDTCYKKELTCKKEEHTHTLECYSNPDADVETEAQWKGTFASVTLTGNWAKDLKAIAETQTGYTESTGNYTVNEDNTTNGYTRYGQWAGTPYADWSATFTSFCLYYADVPETAIARNTGCEGWDSSAVSPDGYTPKEGDIILLDGNQDGITEHAGIVTAGSADSVTAIVGDSDKAVRRNTYSTSDAIITGYVSMPENPALADEESETEPTAAPETTEETEPTATPAPEVTEGTETTETPTPEATEEPEATPAPVKNKKKLRAFAEADNAVAENSDTQVNERITVKVTPKENGGQGKNGETLHANVNSQYSSADIKGDVTVQVDISELPEGVTLVGFDNEKKMLVEYKHGETSKQIAVYLKDREDGTQYVEFQQPEGSTINFDLTFNSLNGVMDKSQSITLTPQVVDKTDKDKTSDPVQLTWTGENKWSNLKKTVDNTKLSVDPSTNHLIGQLNYSISAQEQNADGKSDTGSIWTKEVKLKDTLQLPAGISFPDGAQIDNTAKTVVDGNGNVLFSFSKLDRSYITELTLGADKKSVQYKIVIPNTNTDTDGVPTKEMSGIDISAALDISKLTLADNYVSRSEDEIAADIIENTVSIETVAYKGDDSYKDTKSVTSVPDVGAKIQFSKSHKGQNGETAEYSEVKSGEEIEYTITIRNTGAVALEEKDEEGNTRQVVDCLPGTLVLTDQQISALENLGAKYDKVTRTITWASGEIASGETKTLTFKVNVADAGTIGQSGTTISNTASFDDKTSTTNVKYQGPEVTIQKENYQINGSKIESGQEVVNKDTITYKITLTNNNNSKSRSQTVTDTLQSGLSFKKMVDSSGNELSIDDEGNFCAESVINKKSSEQGHTVKLKRSNQNLEWTVGQLEPYETVTMYMVCEVDTNNLGGASSVKNKASTNEGKNDESEEIEVDYQLTVDKKVKGSADTDYNDGGGSYKYGENLDYSITMKNAEDNQAYTGDDLILQDSLGRGLIPAYSLYKLKESSKNKEFSKGQVTVSDLELVEDLTFEQYLTENTDYNAKYYTVIEDEVVKVTRPGWYENGIFNKLELSWFIGKLDPGESQTKHYQAYLYRTESEKESSGSVAKEFSNTAKINGTSDTVKVYGKREKGSLVIRKEIQGTYGNDITKLTEEQKKEISFKLTKKDTGEVKEFTLNDFSTADKAGKLEIGDLEYGTYIIQETSGTIENDITPEVTVGRVNESGQIIGEKQTTNSYEFTIDENTVNEYWGVQFVNKYSSAKQADIRKDVWGIVKGEFVNDSWSLQEISTKDVFLLKGSEATEDNTYIIYNITVANTGKEKFEVSTVIDNLDDSGKLSFIGIYCGHWWEKAMEYPSNYMTTTETFTGKAYTDYTGTLQQAKITADSPTADGKVIFNIQSLDGSVLKLSENQGISFFVMCKVAKNAQEDVYLNNTATLEVDSDVEYKPYGVIKTKNTTNDANQNNGDSWDDGYDENREHHYISSSVGVKPTEIIRPGITKSATGYVELGKKIDTIQDIKDVKTNIAPQSAVRWKIELLNDGTKAINSYTITDSVDAPFHILSKSEAEGMGITDEATRKQYNVFTLEILDASGRRVGDVHDLSEKVWNAVQDDKQQSVSIDIPESEGMSIPAGGKAVFTVYTNNTVFSNKIYTNTATFSPSEKFKGSDVGTGQLVTDEKNNPTGVKAEAAVYALGDYASFSWKTIEEEGNTSNKAEGYNAQNNYITIDKDSTNRTVIYTNNIENTSNNKFSKFVVVDLMPYSGDTGVLNQADRSSEFKVNFINDTMNIFITDSSESVQKTLSINNDYKIKYSAKTSFDDNEITSGTLGDDWHDSWSDTDKSFAIVFEASVTLEPGQTLKMQYKGLISDEAQPGQIAWNSFGYKYTALNSLKEPVDLRAEPPKVGVMIQKKAIIEKQVIDSNGKTQPYDSSKKFTFTVYEGDSTKTELGKFTLCQGGSEKLENIKRNDGNAMFISGETYTVVETDENGCEFVSVGIKGDTPSTENKYTFTYESKANKIDILFTNRQSAYVLPETGGIGTNRFTAVGLSLMAASLMCGYIMRRKRRERRGN